MYGLLVNAIARCVCLQPVFEFVSPFFSLFHFLLRRLMNCSDIHTAHVCSQCGGMISVYAHSGDYASSYGTAGTILCLAVFVFSTVCKLKWLWIVNHSIVITYSPVFFSLFFFTDPGSSNSNQSFQKCSTCKSAAHVQPVHLPYVFRYLANELAGMGIKLSLKLSE